MRIKNLFSLFFSGLSLYSAGQIVQNTTLPPSSLVQNVLVGQGITASNITFNGSAANANITQANVVSFTATNFPFAEGVWIKTENSPSVSSDPDLNILATNTVTNGGVLEFDFVPQGDTLKFRYIFGSDEYPTYVCSGFNDVFGFFISGPGISGPFSNGAENVALVPNSTTPVSINSVNPGVAGSAGSAATCNAQYPGWQANNIYYTITFSPLTGYSGGTVALTAIKGLVCGETYHIKLAISNVGDQSLNSGVFLEANSFTSDAVAVSVATVTGDTSVVEGCTQASFIFTRPITQVNDTLIINYDITGSALPGADFNTLPSPITFLPGEDSVVITFNPIQDNISEAPEYVNIVAYTISACGDTIESVGTIWILDGPNLLITENDPTTYCPNDSVVVTASASGGYPPYTYLWSYLGQTGTTAYVPALANGSYNYTVTATDQCGFQGIDTVTVTMAQTLAVDTVYQQQSNACQPTGVTVGVGQGITGQPQYNWIGPGQNGPIEIDASVSQNLPPGWYYFTITDDVCTVFDSIEVTSLPGPIATMTPSVITGCTPLSVTFSNTSQNSNSYNWNFGDGTVQTVNNLSDQTHVFTNASTVTLIVSDGVCYDTTTVGITISVCGCTNPIALNYNPIATIDDGSCVYPTPEIQAPNVFTPNSDGDNDFFYINATNSQNITIRIMNRWGNLMMEASGANPIWNGFNDGKEATEGVYFYTYTVTGVAGDVYEGQGFVQLIRN